MAKQKFNITNWKTYNHALRQRGSLTIWLSDAAAAAWYDTAEPIRRGRPLRYSDTAIVTALMLKGVFHLALRALQGFIDSVFHLINAPLRSPDYTSISKRAKSVDVNIRTPTRGEIAHLVIDSTGLKVFAEGEWKVKKQGAEKRRVWRIDVVCVRILNPLPAPRDKAMILLPRSPRVDQWRIAASSSAVKPVAC